MLGFYDLYGSCFNKHFKNFQKSFSDLLSVSNIQNPVWPDDLGKVTKSAQNLKWSFYSHLLQVIK